MRTDSVSGAKWNRQRTVTLSRVEATLSELLLILRAHSKGGSGSKASVVPRLGFIEHFEQSVQAVAEMNDGREFAAGLAQWYIIL